MPGPWWDQLAVGTGDGVNVVVAVEVEAIVGVIGTVVGMVTVTIGGAVSVGARGVGVSIKAGAAIVIPTQASIRKETPTVIIRIFFTLLIEFPD